jgi:predicted nucleotidyltransferase
MVALNVQLDQLAEVCRRHHVRELAVFGSVARGQSRPDSDIDVLVEFEPDARVGFLALARLAHELTGLFRRKVDLVPKDGLKPRIRDQVLSEAEVLFAA